MDNKDDGYEADRDMFTKSSDMSDIFPATFDHTAETELGQDYVIHLVPSSTFRSVLAGASGYASILDAATGKKTSGWRQKGLTGLRFSPQNESLVYTASSLDSVKLWDLRSGTDKPAKVFMDTSLADSGPEKGGGRRGGHVEKKSVISFDVSSDDAFLAAGTAQVVEDAFLLFWDVRSENMLGGYWDSFGNDVTSVQFHPTNSDRLATGGADGLINVFDVSQETEDDALLSALNPEISSVKKLTWFERKNDKEALATTSDNEELVVWPRVVEGTAGEEVRLTREDVTIGIRRKTAEWCYLVDAHRNGNDGLTVVAKSTFEAAPCLRLATVNKKNRLKSYADLRYPTKNGGGGARCSALDPLSGTVCVGDEQGRVHWWTRHQ